MNARFFSTRWASDCADMDSPVFDRADPAAGGQVRNAAPSNRLNNPLASGSPVPKSPILAARWAGKQTQSDIPMVPKSGMVRALAAENL